MKKAIIQEREEKTLLKITITEKQERITNLNVELLQKVCLFHYKTKGSITQRING